MLCNFSQHVSLILGVQIGAAYSSMLLIVVLYVAIIVSLVCPHPDPASDLRMFNFFVVDLRGIGHNNPLDFYSREGWIAPW